MNVPLCARNAFRLERCISGNIMGHMCCIAFVEANPSNIALFTNDCFVRKTFFLPIFFLYMINIMHVNSSLFLRKRTVADWENIHEQYLPIQLRIFRLFLIQTEAAKFGIFLYRILSIRIVKILLLRSIRTLCARCMRLMELFARLSSVNAIRVPEIMILIRLFITHILLSRLIWISLTYVCY